MKPACFLLTALFLLGSALRAEDLTEYSTEEIENFLQSFKSTSKDKKVPEEDANTAVAELVKAFRWLEHKAEKGEGSKDDEKLIKKIVKSIAKGLKLRRRPLVTLECAKALGLMGHKDGAKPLSSWMDRTVLDAKSPNPQWVEYGFMAMAAIGSQDNNSMGLVTKYAGGSHLDDTVTPLAMKAAYHWRELSPKNRKEVFKKILDYLAGRFSTMNGSDQKRKGNAEKEYKSSKRAGLKALKELSGETKGFPDPVEWNKWWRSAKKAKWETYVGVEFRKKAAEKKDAGKDKDADKEKAG